MTADQPAHELTLPAGKVKTIRCSCGSRFRKDWSAIQHVEVLNHRERTEGWPLRELEFRVATLRALGNHADADLAAAQIDNHHRSDTDEDYDR